MRTEGQAHLLRIFVNESDRWEGRAVYETIVRAAREQGLAGATALRAIEGFGAGGRIHSVKVLHLSEDVPIVVEIIDTPERIAAFLPTLDKIVAEGIVTVEKIHVLTYRRNNSEPRHRQHRRRDPARFGRTRIQRSNHLPCSSNRTIAFVKSWTRLKSRPQSRDGYTLIASMCCWPCCANQKESPPGHSPTWASTAQSFERTLRETVSRDETSTAFLKALDAKSAAAAKWLDHKVVGTEHLLLALCQIRPNAATDILTRLGAQPRDVCKEVLKILDHADDWQGWLADHPDM